VIRGFDTTSMQQTSAGMLDFLFDIGQAHRFLPTARLWLPARIRDALIRAGIDTLNELHGLTARDVAALPRFDARDAVQVVIELRWRCVESLPSWRLLRSMPVHRLWWPRGVAARLARRGAADVQSVFGLGVERFAVAAARTEGWARRSLDLLARIAELTPDRLRAVSGRQDPWELPSVDPVVLLAFARAETVEEQVVALAISDSVRDTALLLGRWLHSENVPPTFEVLGRSAGVTGERARQIVTEREHALRSAGLKRPPALYCNGGAARSDCAGPASEEGTHFCDLFRQLGVV
jgi:hypothetical protein